MQFPRDGAADGVAVVGHLERPEALVADVERLGRETGFWHKEHRRPVR